MTGPMSRDERIAAFLDGELDEAGLAAFEAELGRDPELAADVEWLMANDALLREAFAAPIEEGVSASLLMRMGLGQSTGQSTGPAAGGPVAANDNPPFWRRWQVPLGGAIAAALALTLMFAAQKSSAPASGFDTALDGTPSGQVAALDGGRELRPLLTFRAGDGRYCREFAIGRGEAGCTGIACRTGGVWQVEALDQGATELAARGGIALASGEDGAGLDAAYARLGAGDPLGAAGERALIASGWASGWKNPAD